MRKQMLLIVLLWLHSSFVFSDHHSIHALLNELDQTLRNGSFYMEQKELRINRLKNQFEQEFTLEKQFELCSQIIEEYKSYKSDSALVYIHRNMEYAQIFDRNIWLIRTELQYSFVLSCSGLFVESKEVLNRIKRDEIPKDLLVEYFKCYEQLYVNMNIYQDKKPLENDYGQKVRNAIDSVLFYLPEQSKERLFYNFMVSNAENKLAEAKNYLKEYLLTLQPGTHEYAKKNYSMALLYARTGDTDNHLRHLIRAAISDIKDAVKENRALSDLSVCLFERKDISRSFHYIQYALSDANFYGANFRFIEISKLLPIITATNQEENNRQNQRLKVTFVIISILFILLSIVTVYLFRQMKVLAKVRLNLKESNENLATINRKLNRLNRDLSSANLVKEEYVGYFLDLCSEYIRYLENYKKEIHTKIATKQYEELLRMTSIKSDKTSEIKELYADFDRAFLTIFPQFVISLNDLLEKEARFEIKKGDLLNTELRIFALIRLGITDSSKIAAFLRCSVQTVYNYRSKIKKNSVDQSMDIEDQIRSIGVFTMVN
ncbi:MAG: DUF6377 domain-containing protein [Tannerella sp.]|jgi:DNA-binding CsgD family transcriptional regulator/cell division protein FtsB|nr:DUF6377 domain-containing protein [Tannerella sp.]